MVTKSKLRMALAAEKGVDFNKLREKKKQKAAAKRKQAEQTKRGADGSDDSNEEGEEEHASDESEGEENDGYGNGVRYYYGAELLPGHH